MDNRSNRLDCDLICIQFPGIVKNDERAIECLGGIKNISQVYTQPTKRVGLSYQPENPFIKQVFADSKKAAGILLKVKVKKRTSNNKVQREVLSTTVLGRVSKIYKFESMCDFQYMPVHKEGNGDTQCILEQILPSGTEDPSFMLAPVPRFITPSCFTRAEKPTKYFYHEKKNPDKTVAQHDDDVHNRSRSDRGMAVSRFVFNLVDDLPSEPHEMYLQRKNSKLSLFPHYEQELGIVKKLFEQRPIWSSNLIKYETKIKTASMKIIMPCVAVYMKNGPWRLLWVRYGYDPRKEPGSRIYQTLDFRLRHSDTAGLYTMVNKRALIHHKKADRMRRWRDAAIASDNFAGLEDVPEGAVFFRPGMVPAQRQIFYQYCDVKLPEVEAIISAEPPPGTLCHLKRGWMQPNVDHVCRDHIFRYVKETLLATHSTDLKFEQASSDEEGTGDDASSSSASDIDEPSNT